MTITVVTDERNWRRIYVNRECVREGPTTRITDAVIREVMAKHGVERCSYRTIESFDFLEEAGGIAQ